jgi:hypothetical protein
MIRRVRFSPALFIACLALTVALGGVSYAAVSLPKNSVTSKQVKDHSLKKKDLTSGASTIKGPRPKTIRGVLAIGGDSNGRGELFTDSLSFVFTLALPPAVNRVGVGEPLTAACPSSDPPEAAEGNFCLYESARNNANFVGFVDPVTNRTGVGGRQGVEAQYESDGSGPVSVRGSWAVNAP